MQIAATTSSSRRPTSAMRSWRLRWIAASLLTVLVTRAAAAEVVATEPELKAVFLYNFARFIHWPDDALKHSATFTICVLGQDPIEQSLASTIEGKKIGNLPIVTRRFDSAPKASDCRILFISASEHAQIDRVLAKVKGGGVLTVADTESFAEHGGMIGFHVDGGRMRLEVNVEVAEEAQLKISSQLLKLARIVPGGESPQ